MTPHDKDTRTTDVIYEAIMPMRTHADYIAMQTHMRWLSNTMEGVPVSLSRMEAYRRFCVKCLRMQRTSSAQGFSATLDGGLSMQFEDNQVTVRKTMCRSAHAPGASTLLCDSPCPTIYGRRSKRQCTD